MIHVATVGRIAQMHRRVLVESTGLTNIPTSMTLVKAMLLPPSELHPLQLAALGLYGEFG